MHRLFVALRPPPPARRALLSLTAGVEGARWQDDEQLHLTLRFIGDVDRHRAEDIAIALGRITAPPIELALSGVGAFDRRGMVDTLWVGVRPHDAVTALHRKIDRAVQVAGVEADHRAFLPHITLARLRRPESAVAAFLGTHAGLSGAAFTCDWFGLFESRLGHEGARYALIERYPLA